MNALSSATTTTPPGRATVRLEGTLAATPDGYAGSAVSTPRAVRTSAASTTSSSRSLRGPALVFSFMAGLAVLGGPTANCLAQTAPAQQVQTVSQNQQTANWMDVFPAAFQARTQRNADAFMKTVSPNGVDVRGLSGQDGFTHLTKDQLSHDLKTKGAFYQQAFTNSDAKFVIAPDNTGLVGSVLLD